MKLLKIGLILIFAGILLMILSIMLLTLMGFENSSISLGGCIILLFIPICVGVGEQWQWILFLSVILLALILIFHVYSTIYVRRRIQSIQ